MPRYWIFFKKSRFLEAFIKFVIFCCRHTEAEGQIEEISGVAFIFNQKFFNDLFEAKGIDLENIVYYKDETHYFVMTAKKQSLIDKGMN